MEQLVTWWRFFTRDYLSSQEILRTKAEPKDFGLVLSAYAQYHVPIYLSLFALVLKGDSYLSTIGANLAVIDMHV